MKMNRNERIIFFKLLALPNNNLLYLGIFSMVLIFASIALHTNMFIWVILFNMLLVLILYLNQHRKDIKLYNKPFNNYYTITQNNNVLYFKRKIDDLRLTEIASFYIIKEYDDSYLIVVSSPIATNYKWTYATVNKSDIERINVNETN